MRRNETGGWRRDLRALLACSSLVMMLASEGCVDDPVRRRTSDGGGGGAAAGGALDGGSGGAPGAPGASGSVVGGQTADEGGAPGAAPAGGEPAVNMPGGGEAAGGAGSGNVQAAGGEPVGGSAGSANVADGGEGGVFSGPCPPSALDGWASVAGIDFDPASAAATPLEIDVSTAEELATYASSPDPYVIRVSGTIALPVLDVSSNKQIIGIDGSATLEGGIRIAGSSTDPAGMVSNVVIRNLRINAQSSLTSNLTDEADGIGIAYAHHVWIDHVEVWDAPGDDLDITNGSDYVTVSWTKFRFDVSPRRTATRVGHSDDNAAEDAGRLKVTFHHNWWASSANQRMPRVRFGDVHVFDNYYSHSSTDPLNTYCVAAALESRLLVENNFFDRVQNPHVFFSFINGQAAYAEPTAEMVVRDNAYAGEAEAEAGQQSGQGSAFVPPYAVALQPADSLLRATIRECAGSLDPVAPDANGAAGGVSGGAAGAAP